MSLFRGPVKREPPMAFDPPSLPQGCTDRAGLHLIEYRAFVHDECRWERVPTVARCSLVSLSERSGLGYYFAWVIANPYRRYPLFRPMTWADLGEDGREPENMVLLGLTSTDRAISSWKWRGMNVVI